ncbi:MAG: methyltransferase domain-containing protein [Dehalococcoidia bacterium]
MTTRHQHSAPQTEGAMTTRHQHSAPQTEGATITWWARFYDPIAWLSSFGTISNVRKATIKAARLQPGESVLDVGCGTGDLTLRAARKVGAEARVAGIDASPDMIGVANRKAAAKGRKIDFRLAPIEDLPFADSEFDVALSSFMLHHLPDDLKVRGLAEVCRVLKPGGRLIAVDIKPDGGPIGLFMKLVGHSLPDDYPDQLRSAITDAGFKAVELVNPDDRVALFLRATK